MTTVAFVIPVRNDAVRLDACLRSIRANHYPPGLVDIIVADNGSTDESAAVARKHGATVLNLPNLRLGRLRNAAARAASHAEIVAFVDADHEIVPDWASSAIDVLADEHVAAVGAPYRPPSPATWVQRLYDQLRRHPVDQEAVEWLGSGNMAVRRSAFEAVNGFDTILETCEDVDLCRKLRGLGYTLMADDRLQSVHYGDPRTLRHVFFGELWRGRDNIRVSFRPPRTWRTVVSAVIPVFNSLVIGVCVIGLVWGTRPGVMLAALAGACVIALIGLRASVMLSRAPARDVLRAFAVAAAYELGRTLAVVGRFGHGRRRKGATT